MYVHHYPESAIGYALNGILTPGMRKHAGIDSARGVAGDDVASSIAAVSLPDDNTPDESASSMACEDGAMIEGQDQRFLLARMEAAQADAKRHLCLIERQIAARAERMTITDRAKRRPHGRSASSWTNADMRLFQQHVAELARLVAAILTLSRVSSIGRRWRLPSFGRAIGFPLRGGERRKTHQFERERRARTLYVEVGSSAGLARSLTVSAAGDPWPSPPRFVLRSEPATVRFKGKSQAIGGRRLAMGWPRPSQA